MLSFKGSRWLGLLPLSLIAASGQQPDSTSELATVDAVTIPAAPIPKPRAPEFTNGGGCESPAPDIDREGKPFAPRASARKTNIMSPEFEGGHAFYPLKSNPSPGPGNDTMLQLVLAGPTKVAPGKP